MRILLRKAVLVFVSLCVCLGLIEVFVRITGWATDLPYQKGDQFQGFVFIPNQKGTSVVGKFGEQKAKFNINSDGWNAVRNYTPQRSVGTTRLAVIGDSIILATNVDNEGNAGL